MNRLAQQVAAASTTNCSAQRRPKSRASEAGASSYHLPWQSLALRPATVQPLFKRHDGANEMEDPHAIADGLNSAAEPLNPATRAYMEMRFGQDFSAVRVHADGQAAKSAEAVNALAYTVGGEIVFGQNRYAPHTNPGRGLLAHELAHVVQQTAGNPVNNQID